MHQQHKEAVMNKHCKTPEPQRKAALKFYHNKSDLQKKIDNRILYLKAVAKDGTTIKRQPIDDEIESRGLLPNVNYLIPTRTQINRQTNYQVTKSKKSQNNG